MAVTPLPSLSRTDPAFKSKTDTFFGTELPTFTTEVNSEIERINQIGLGTYSATSSTSLTIGTGSKSLTIETGKSFTVGQPVIIASTAGPTNYMTGQVTSYNSGTGALVVNVTAVAGSGTIAAWTVSVTAVVAGGGVSPDSIVVLTSGTSWTCPAGVTKARLRIGGAGGGGYAGNGSNISYGTGGSGGYLEAIITVLPGSSYAYAIGAGGVGGSGGGANPGGAGGATTFTAGGITFTANGGAATSGGTASGTGALLISGVATGVNMVSGAPRILGPENLLGCAGGDALVAATGDGGDAGKIVLELYK